MIPIPRKRGEKEQRGFRCKSVGMYDGKRYVCVQAIGVMQHKEEDMDNQGDGEENKHQKNSRI